MDACVDNISQDIGAIQVDRPASISRNWCRAYGKARWAPTPARTLSAKITDMVRLYADL